MRSIRASWAPSARLLLVLALAAAVGSPLAGCQPSENGPDGTSAEQTSGEPGAVITDTLGTDPQATEPEDQSPSAGE